MNWKAVLLPCCGLTETTGNIICLPEKQKGWTVLLPTETISGLRLITGLSAVSYTHLSFYISQLYFNDEKAGYASAVGIMTFFIIMIVALPVNAYLRKKEVEY